MRPTYLLFTAGLLMGVWTTTSAQTIDEVVKQIALNNRSLQAITQSTIAEKAATRSENNLNDPTVEYSYLWGKEAQAGNVSELVASQTFNFPTLYTSRAQLGKARRLASDRKEELLRQNILLQAREKCIDLVSLRLQYGQTQSRLRDAEQLLILFRQRLERGDANLIEVNRVRAELLNLQTEATLEHSRITSLETELIALNGGQTIRLTQEQLTLTPLPASLQKLQEEVLPQRKEWLTAEAEKNIAQRLLSTTRQGWLPELTVGYRRNTEGAFQFNGVMMGVSLPLFANRSKTRTAKASALAASFNLEESRIVLSSELKRLYDEALALRKQIDAYTTEFTESNDLSLLRKALEGGEIGMAEYFSNTSLLTQSRSNCFRLAAEYEKKIGQIYRDSY